MLQTAPLQNFKNPHLLRSGMAKSKRKVIRRVEIKDSEDFLYEIGERDRRRVLDELGKKQIDQILHGVNSPNNGIYDNFTDELIRKLGTRVYKDYRGVNYLLSDILLAILKHAKTKKERDTIVRYSAQPRGFPQPINPARTEAGYEDKQVPRGNGSRRAEQYRHQGL